MIRAGASDSVVQRQMVSDGCVDQHVQVNTKTRNSGFLEAETRIRRGLVRSRRERSGPFDASTEHRRRHVSWRSEPEGQHSRYGEPVLDSELLIHEPRFDWRESIVWVLKWGERGFGRKHQRRGLHVLLWTL